MTTTNDIALSSVNGKSWFGGEPPLSWPADPDPSVKRLVLGDLKGGGISVDEATLAGLKDIRKHFPGLTHLHLWTINNLEEVGGLPDNVKCLDIRKCPELRKIGPVAAGLEKLDLAECQQLQALPAGDLKTVKEAWLEGCASLKEFGPLKEAVGSLETLVLYGAGVKDLNPDLFGEPGDNVAVEVRQFFKAKDEQGTAWLAECKVVVLGNGGVGKTELVRVLKGLKYNSSQISTDGIQLWKWDGDKFPPFLKQGVTQLDLNIWDFGGQDLYHNTHRLFLESRAVFLVVWRQPKKDGEGKVIPFRKEHPHDPIRPLNYWLDQVHAVHGTQPNVILVRTGMDEDETNPPEEWRTEDRPEYHSLPVFEVSSATGTLNGLKEALLEAVRVELGGHKAVEIPKGRLTLRRQLGKWQPSLEEGEKMVDSPKPILPLPEYTTLAHQIFEEAEMAAPTELEVETQLTQFHNSGAIYFPRQWAGHGTEFPVIVDQRWVIDGIYELIRDGKARDGLMSRRGDVSSDYLAKVWNQVMGENGAPRYDGNAQKAMKQFMLSCGLLIDGGRDRFVFPEYLPDWETLVDTGAENSPVKTVAQASEATVRKYWMKHRALGLGFGCLLVGEMVRKFGKIPVFRYGAVAEVKVGNQFTDGGEREVLIKVEWFREEAEKHYQGDIILSIIGGAEADREVVAMMDEILQKLPGFPKELNFTRFDGSGLQWAENIDIKMQVRPKKVNAIVGISMAGEDKNYPGIGFWPRVLEAELKAAAHDRFEVLCYKSDDERSTVSELTRDLTRSDLMLVVVSQKYLYSPYCMVELFEAAKYHQAENTFSDPQAWTKRIWPLILPDAREKELARKEEKKDMTTMTMREEWVRTWVREGSDYERKMIEVFGSKKAALENSANKHVYDSWMRFACESETETAKVLDAINDSRTTNCWQPVDPPAHLAGEDLRRWAAQNVKPLIERIVKEMDQIIARQQGETL